MIKLTLIQTRDRQFELRQGEFILSSGISIQQSGSDLVLQDLRVGSHSISDFLSTIGHVGEGSEPLEILFDLSDEDTGKTFQVQNLGNQGLITRVKLWSDFTSSGGFDAFARVNKSGGILPNETSIPYDSDVPPDPFQVNDYITINNEILRVTGVANKTLSVIRGLKGTNPTYLPDDAAIEKPFGIRMIIRDGSSAPKILEIIGMDTWQDTLRSAVSQGSLRLPMTNSISNLDSTDFVLIEDEIGEVQSISGTVSGDPNLSDCVFVKSPLSDHQSGKPVSKLIYFDTPFYFSGSLNGELQVDEKLSSAITIFLSVEGIKIL